MSCCQNKCMWWLVLFSITVAVVSGSRRRPLRLFPFVQARQRNNNNNNDKNKQQQQEEESLTDGFVSEPYDVSEEHDDDQDNNNNKILPHSLLQVPCSIEIPNESHHRKPVTTIVDTGAQVTVLSAEAAQKCGLVALIDQRYAGQATGVGNCRVLGRIPAGALILHLSTHTTVPSPAITVLDNNSMGMDLLLGLDFLRDTGAILNMKDEEMFLSNNEEHVVIPFVRPKKEIDAGYSGGWINQDIVSSLENTRAQSRVDPYDCSDDEEEGDDDFDERFDMSGV